MATVDWKPTRMLLPATRIAAKSSLVAWDFDCSLAVRHMWSELRSEAGQQVLKSDPSHFYDLIFGGAARIARLRQCLIALTGAGATLVILSNGIEEEIEAALTHVGLREFFALVLGGESQMRHDTAMAGKPALLAKLALGAVDDCPPPQSGAATVEHVVFIDDDMDNYPEGGLRAERQSWTLDAGSTAATPVLIAWPVVPAEGLSAAGMHKLESLLGAEATYATSAPPSPPAETRDDADAPVDVADASSDAPTPVAAPAVELAPSLSSLPPPPMISATARKHTNEPTKAWEIVRASKTQKQTVLPNDALDPAQLPAQPPAGSVRFVFVSDTHSKHSTVDVPPGDVLVHCGDFSSTGTLAEVSEFCEWLAALPHARKIVIAGNHDLTLDAESYETTGPRFGHKALDASASRALCNQARALIDGVANCEYLLDAGTSVGGVSVWGSPWQPEFCGWAFNLPRGEACRAKWRLIPAGTDVVLTHGPPLGHGDLCQHGGRAGCLDLLEEIQTRVRPQYHVFGHIHEGFGATSDGVTTYVNASTCTLRYRPEHPPVVMDVRPRAVDVGKEGKKGGGSLLPAFLRPRAS